MPVTPGDKIEINKVSVAFTVVVHSLSATRGPANTTKELYKETEESQNLRQQRSEQSRIADQMLPRYRGRPNKHERQRLLLQKGKR